MSAGLRLLCIKSHVLKRELASNPAMSNVCMVVVVVSNSSSSSSSSNSTLVVLVEAYTHTFDE